MVRRYVYLQDALVREIKFIAAITKKSQAEVIREALAYGLKAMAAKKPNTAKGLLALAELGRRLNAQGPPDMSTNLDRYLYDDEG